MKNVKHWMVRAMLATVVPALMSGCHLFETDVDLPDGVKVIYKRGVAVPSSEFTLIGPPEVLGGVTVKGPMTLSAHTDFFQGETGAWAGVLQSTRGTARFVMDQDRHETVLVGSLEITDQFGNVHELEEGDTYLARQGSTITWKAKDRKVQTTFLTYPGTEVDEPVIVYPMNSSVPEEDLVFLGTTDDFGVTTISGEPNPLWRIDTAGAGQFGGVIQQDQSVIEFNPPYFADVEHGTVMFNTTLFTDGVGNVTLLEPGDSYFVDKDFAGVWDQTDAVFQKTFLTGTAPPPTE